MPNELNAPFTLDSMIHLGWHYAADSYLAWALTLVIWFAVLPIARWWHSTAAQGDFDRALASAA